METRYDKTEILEDGSLIQHGPYNDRIYLMKASDDSTRLPGRLKEKAENTGYSKIFAKIPADMVTTFIAEGFVIEASVPRFFNGATAGLFLACYMTESRQMETDAAKYDANLDVALKREKCPVAKLDKKFRLRQCGPDDVVEMTKIYKEVFPTYPFPIHEEDYLAETMQSHVDYYGIEHKGKLVALSSAEMDISASNAEMTDFATLPDWRGNGFGVHLLDRMEKEIKRKGIKIPYTIARAASPGMNITFAKLGYKYGGRLKNNTNISGRIESMNVWYKTVE